MKASLWDRLRKRKLVQWALAYLAGAWVVVEASSLVADQFHLPDVVGQGITVVAMFGLPVVLVLAWYHGEKGHQRVGGTEILAIAAILGVAGLVLTRLPGSGVDQDGGTADLPFEVEPLGPTSVAVLPFDALGTDAGAQDPIAAGIHSELLTQLTKIGALEVIGRASVSRYASTDKTLQTIGRELGVANIAGGTVAREADRVRLNVQLTEAATGAQLWADAYEWDLTAASLFELQAQVATEIARGLGIALSAEERVGLAERPTDDLEAYEAYLLGKNHFEADRGPEAVAAFERATDLDPMFASAWAGLGGAAARSYYLSSGRRGDDLGKAREALAHARRLAPESVETLIAEGIFLTYVDLDYDRALTQLSSALAQRPSDVDVLVWTSNVLRHADRWEEALATGRRAVALDPMNGEAVQRLGYTLRYTRRFEDAMRYADRAAVLTPDDPTVLRDRVLTALWGFGDTALATTILEGTPPMPSLAAMSRGLGRQLAWTRRDPDALAAMLADSLWTNLQSAGRYDWLRRLQSLSADSALHAAYVDSLIGVREANLESRLSMEPTPYQSIVEGVARSGLGLAYALAGRSEQAIRESELATQLFPRSLTAVNANITQRYVVLAYIALGHAETAIDRIELGLSLPDDLLSVERLRLDPDFDSLRDHPRFQALLAKYGSGR